MTIVHHLFLITHFLYIELHTPGKKLIKSVRRPWNAIDRIISNGLYGIYYLGNTQHRSNKSYYEQNGGILRYIVGSLLIATSIYKARQSYYDIKNRKTKPSSKKYLFIKGIGIMSLCVIGLRMLIKK